MEEEYLLKKWLSGNLSEEETQRFQSLDNYTKYKTLVDEASRFKASSFSTVDDYSALRKKIDQKRSGSARGLFYWSSRIAAVFVLGFALYFAFFSSGTNSWRTGVGEKNRIELPDASLVILNASSSLEYSGKGWKDERRIELEGEAFFDVVKGSTFMVITPMGDITVLGTEFNVKQRGSQLEVSCFEGRVRVVSSGLNRVLEAGDKVRLDGGDLNLVRIMEKGPSWPSDISTFEEAPFGEVLEELERQYQITVQCEKSSVKEILFTGGFTHEDLEDAIRSVADPLNLSYSITDQNTVILRPRE